MIFILKVINIISLYFIHTIFTYIHIRISYIGLKMNVLNISNNGGKDLEQIVSLLNESTILNSISTLENSMEYRIRLCEEIIILSKLKMINFIARFKNIYDVHISKYPNLLRGSAGSSLILYVLGINKIDPIANSIPLGRFINELRETPPDIDIDVPTSLRDKIIKEIIDSNTDTIRMSTNNGCENNKYFDDLIREDPTFNIAHSSGIIIFTPEQQTIIDSNKISENQIGLTKFNYDKYGLKKIDLLSNTALDQLAQIDPSKTIDSYDFEDPQVFEFIGMDDGIGITFGETPHFQNVLKILHPKTINELSICCSLIRPFACWNISNKMNWENLREQIIYDDDLMQFIVNKLGITEEKSDQIRRMFKKNTDKEKMKNFIEFVENSNLIPKDKYKLKTALLNLHKYSFCKSHSLNYSRLIYCLYWTKYYKPKLFWRSVIKNVKGYYRDWVYIRKALNHDIKFKGIENCSPF